MEVSCPISSERVNENVVRLIAGLVAVVAIVCIASGNYYAMFFLLIDFTIRSFTDGKLSLLKKVAQLISGWVSLPVKFTDLAPKKFAATLGFSFCLTISILLVLGFLKTIVVLSSLLLLFAILESVFAVCVGCHVYSLLMRLFPNK